MSNRPLDKSQVFAAANGRWDEVFAQLAPELSEAMERAGRHVACPHPEHGGADDFRLFTDFKDTGGGICNCGGGRDGIAVLRWLHGWSFPEAIEQVGLALGLEREQGYVRDERGRSRPRFAPQVSTPSSSSVSDEENLRRRRKLKEVWQGGIPVDSDDAEPLLRYFEHRGLDPLQAIFALGQEARFHPSLPLWEKGEKPGEPPQKLGDFPALLTLVRDAEGRPVSVHRTWLAEDGRGKAPVSKPRKMMAFPSDRSVEGGHIRLGAVPEDGVIGVAEGLETAMAAMQATGMPVWPCLAERILRGFEPPAGVTGVVVFCDRDTTGIGAEAGEELVGKLREAGLRARAVVPPAPSEGDKADWLDTLNEYGADAFPKRRTQRRSAA